MIFKGSLPLRGYRMASSLFLILITASLLIHCRSADSNTKEENAQIAAKIPFPRPKSHEAGWLEYHGNTAGMSLNAPGRRGDACYTCHERNDCIRCHNIQLPRDHTNTWRTRTHGFMVSAERGRCQTCHRQDYCVRCHYETAPRSHRGNWRRAHCASCHFGSIFTSLDNCTVCHRQALHASAPHPINEQLDCFSCH